MANISRFICDKFRPTDTLHWLILTCWTLGVIAITYTIAQVLA